MRNKVTGKISPGVKLVHGNKVTGQISPGVKLVNTE